MEEAARLPLRKSCRLDIARDRKRLPYRARAGWPSSDRVWQREAEYAVPSSAAAPRCARRSCAPAVSRISLRGSLRSRLSTSCSLRTRGSAVARMCSRKERREPVMALCQGASARRPSLHQFGDVAPAFVSRAVSGAPATTDDFALFAAPIELLTVHGVPSACK